MSTLNLIICFALISAIAAAIITAPEKFRIHPKQMEYITSKKRFTVVPSGRRSGKTWIAKKWRLVLRALEVTGWSDPRYFAAAPTRQQAKDIFWDDLKEMIPVNLRSCKPSETELVISLVNGARIFVIGLDKPMRMEGKPWNGGILDEYGNMKRGAWTENIRPMCTDRLAWVDFIGVPEGRNHYYDLWTNAFKPEFADDWVGIHWWTEHVLPLYLGEKEAAKEIAAARRDMDPLTYDQEYRGSFVTFEGRAYYQFNFEKHASKSLKYSPKDDLHFCFDFNISPGVACVVQELGGKTCVIGEVWIPQNSTTPAVCRKLVQDWKEHEGNIFLYGDATGGAGGSAKVAGSDWDLIEHYLANALRTEKRQIYKRVPKGNPSERARVNSVNSRLESADGNIALLVDPDKAPHVAWDLDNTMTLKGGSGELDKGRRGDESMLTHMSDALGYYIYERYPIGGGRVLTTQEI